VRAVLLKHEVEVGVRLLADERHPSDDREDVVLERKPRVWQR
jgi:hypothetical protein